MTEKQLKIIKAALGLFAAEGYTNTATSKVAKAAGVSEGLIFRHFGNKEGLLKAIMQEGEAKLKLLYAAIVLETDPAQVIKKAIDMPFAVPETDYDFWRLQYKIKWETGNFNPEKTEPLIRALQHAFEQLNAPEPEQEAHLLMLILDQTGAMLLNGTLHDAGQLRLFLHSKYSY